MLGMRNLVERETNTSIMEGLANEIATSGWDMRILLPEDLMV